MEFYALKPHVGIARRRGEVFYDLLCHSHLGTEQLIRLCIVSDSRERGKRSAVRYPNMNSIAEKNRAFGTDKS